MDLDTHMSCLRHSGLAIQQLILEIHQSVPIQPNLYASRLAGYAYFDSIEFIFFPELLSLWFVFQKRPAPVRKRISHKLQGMDSMIHSPELHSVPGQSLDKSGHGVLLRAPTSQSDSVELGAGRKAQGTSLLRGEGRRLFPRGLAPSQSPHQDEKEKEASPPQGSRPPTLR